MTNQPPRPTPGPPVSRRIFLQYATQAPMLAALASTLPAPTPALAATGHPAYWVALGRVFITMEGADTTHADARIHSYADLAGEVIREIERVPADVRQPLMLGAQILRYSGLLVGAWGAFEHLSELDQRALAEKWMHLWIPPLRSAVMAIRSLFALVWYDDPASWSAIGYDGTWVDHSTALVPARTEQAP